MAFEIKKAGSVPREGPVGACEVSQWLRASLPAIAAYLEEARFADGEARERSSLLLFCDEDSDVYKVMLADRCNDRVAFMAGDSPGDALESLEHALQEGRVDWRKDKRAHNGKSPRGRSS